MTEDAVRLADAYIEAGAIESEFRSVARHIALATCAEVDILAGWGFRHMVNRDRIKAYNRVNLRMGRTELRVLHPVEYYQTYPCDAPHDEIDATRLPWWGSGKLEDYDKSGGGYFDAIAFVRWVRAKHAAESLPSACGAKSYDGK